MTLAAAIKTVLSAAYAQANGHEHCGQIHRAIALVRASRLEPGLDGPECPKCGQHGCDCEPDGDPRTYRERIEEEKGERDLDWDRNDR